MGEIMSLAEIFTDAIKYPLSDIKKFLIVGLLALLAGLSNVVGHFYADGTALMSVVAIIGMIFSIVFSGYAVQVIKRGIEHSNEIPAIDLRTNLIDGIKAMIIEIVYLFIPIFITLLFVLSSNYDGLIGAMYRSGSLDFVDLIAILGVAGVIAVIVFLIFEIFYIIALARFADSGEFRAAFKFGEVLGDVKRIGIVNVIAFLIIAFVILFVIGLISGLLHYIPVIGIIIDAIVIGAFTVLFYNKAIGLLYASA